MVVLSIFLPATSMNCGSSDILEVFCCNEGKTSLSQSREHPECLRGKRYFKIVLVHTWQLLCGIWWYLTGDLAQTRYLKDPELLAAASSGFIPSWPSSIRERRLFESSVMLPISSLKNSPASSLKLGECKASRQQIYSRLTYNKQYICKTDSSTARSFSLVVLRPLLSE